MPTFFRIRTDTCANGSTWNFIFPLRLCGFLYQKQNTFSGVVFTCVFCILEIIYKYFAMIVHIQPAEMLSNYLQVCQFPFFLSVVLYFNQYNR